MYRSGSTRYRALRVYLRPANSLADDQVRRNHTVRYFAYPDYDFDRLRREAPETYETYADIALGRWIHMRIVVAGNRAQLYLDHKERPALIVNDLKLGAWRSWNLDRVRYGCTLS